MGRLRGQISDGRHQGLMIGDTIPPPKSWRGEKGRQQLERVAAVGKGSCSQPRAATLGRGAQPPPASLSAPQEREEINTLTSLSSCLPVCRGLPPSKLTHSHWARVCYWCEHNRWDPKSHPNIIGSKVPNLILWNRYRWDAGCSCGQHWNPEQGEEGEGSMQRDKERMSSTRSHKIREHFLILGGERTCEGVCLWMCLVSSFFFFEIKLTYNTILVSSVPHKDSIFRYIAKGSPQ